MKDISTLTAPEILSIPLTTPEKLYTGDVDLAKEEHKKLSRRWHPDRKGGNDKVMAHINTLYKIACSKLELGFWVDEGVMRITTKQGKIFEIKFRRKHDFELGEMYVGDSTVVFAIAEDGYDLVDDAITRIKGLKFANADMKKEFARYLPVIHTTDETQDRRIVVMKKTPDLLLLRDVLEHYKGAIEPKHVAWIISRLYNLSCYLKYANISHNDISPDTVFISPEHHSTALLGGWWYATRLGLKLKAVPSRTMLYAPSDLTAKKLGDTKIDSELIKATGGELLGDITRAGRLSSNDQIPKPMLGWLREAGIDDPYEEYKIWRDRVLTGSFGARRFVELKLKADEVYA